MNKYVKRYLIDAMSGMAQGLFSSLLIGTIIKTLGQQLLRLHVNPVFQFLVDAGNFATDAHVVGAAMAIGIGYAMQVPALVLFSLAAVGSATNVLGGAGGPLAVLIIAIIAAEFGKAVIADKRQDHHQIFAQNIGVVKRAANAAARGIEIDTHREKLKKEIERLEKLARKETQPKKKFELVQELNNLKRKL